MKDALTIVCAAQFKEYLERAEYIKSVIDGQVTVPQASGTGQKARSNGAGGGDKDGVRRACRALSAILSGGAFVSLDRRDSTESAVSDSCLRRQDAEKDKLRSALGSAIMVETPNIKVSEPAPYKC